MANDIIKQLRLAAAPTATIAGVTLSKAATWCDTLSGTVDALIAARIITADQLPGQPGMPKVSATFYNGKPWDQRRQRVPTDPGFLNIDRTAKGKKVTVRIGITEDERDQRLAQNHAQNAAHLATLESKRQEHIARARRGLSEPEYRNIAFDLIVALWRVGSTEPRDAEAIDLFPFELAGDSADALRQALLQVQRIFESAPVQAINPTRAMLLKSRKDSAFQSFLRLQCVPFEGERHA